MSVERLFRWTCDDCGATAERESHGLPYGWTFRPVGVQGIKHRCLDCNEKGKSNADGR